MGRGNIRGRRNVEDIEALAGNRGERNRALRVSEFTPYLPILRAMQRSLSRLLSNTGGNFFDIFNALTGLINDAGDIEVKTVHLAPGATTRRALGKTGVMTIANTDGWKTVATATIEPTDDPVKIWVYARCDVTDSEVTANTTWRIRRDNGGAKRAEEVISSGPGDTFRIAHATMDPSPLTGPTGYSLEINTSHVEIEVWDGAAIYVEAAL